MMQIAILSASIVDSPRGWFSPVYAVPFQASLPGFFKACLPGFANRRPAALVLVVRGDIVQPVVEPGAVIERSHADDFGAQRRRFGDLRQAGGLGPDDAGATDPATADRALDSAVVVFRAIWGSRRKQRGPGASDGPRHSHPKHAPGSPAPATSGSSTSAPATSAPSTALLVAAERTIMSAPPGRREVR
jgi:hypothetical protein